MSIIIAFPPCVKDETEKCGGKIAAARASLLAEGLAVGALVLGGVGLVGANQDPVQGAVVLAVTVIGAGFDGTFDALVCMAVHSIFLL